MDACELLRTSSWPEGLPALWDEISHRPGRLGSTSRSLFRPGLLKRAAQQPPRLDVTSVHVTDGKAEVQRSRGLAQGLQALKQQRRNSNPSPPGPCGLFLMLAVPTVERPSRTGKRAPEKELLPR